MRPASNALGDYLRTRRQLITPHQAGLPHGGLRRVPGLRREEVAMLAGISADYYLRLERGRDRNPSVQVLEALAGALRLDAEQLEYLIALAADRPRRLQPGTRPDRVPTGILKLLGTLSQPAFIEDRYFDVVAANPAAAALSPRLTVGGNQLRAMFLDPDEQALYPDWERVTRCFVASLRQSVGIGSDDPHLLELVRELTVGSAQFRALWAQHEVQAQQGAPMLFDHPRVGALTLNRERLGVDRAGGLHLVVFHPDEASDDARKLAILTSAALPAPTPIKAPADVRVEAGLTAS